MVFVFITRALATGAFQAVYVYTPEVSWVYCECNC